MSKLNDLTSLIARLTKSEKRHITIGINKLEAEDDKFSQINKLFQELNDQTLFVQLAEKELEWKAEKADEDKLKQRKEKFIKSWLIEQTNDKKITKATQVNRLFQLIFDHLRQYNSDKPEFRIDRYLQDIRIYREKRLYAEALKVISKAKDEIIDQYEYHLKGQELLFLEKTIRLEMSGELEDFENLHAETKEQNEQVKILCDVLHDREVLSCYRRMKKTESLSIKILKPPTQEVIADINAADQYSFEIKMHALFNAAMYKQYFGNNRDLNPWEAANSAFPYRRKVYEIFRDDPRKQEFRPDRYKQVKQIYLSGCLQFGHWDEAAELIAEEEKNLGFEWEGDVLKKSHKLSSETEFRALYFIVAYYMHIENYDRLSAIIRHTEDWLLESKTRINIRYSLYVTYSFVGLLINDELRVGKYLEQIKKMHHVSDRSDYILVEVLEIIHLFENQQGAERSLETEIGNLIANLGQQKDTLESQIARDILSSLYLIIAKKATQSAKQEIINVYRQLSESMTRDRIKGTIFAEFPIWIRKRIAELEAEQ